MNPHIIIVGSSNTDMVIQADHLPAGGETILGGKFFMNPGGKGANQAVAAARSGGGVTFICKTGNDVFGRQSIHLFKEEGIDTSYILTDPVQPSGVALITVDKNAENCIVVASGANATLAAADLSFIEELMKPDDIVLMQLEIPVKTVEYVAAIARKKGLMVVLNPAPACELPLAMMSDITIITPNKTEAEMLSGIKITDLFTAREAAEKIKEKGVETVIITLGRMGCVVLHKETFTHVAGYKVNAIDTTAAGDVFNGALVACLALGKTILEAIYYAAKASAISVTRPGAQSAAPYKKEVDDFLGKQ